MSNCNYYLVRFNNPNCGWKRSPHANEKYQYIYIRENSRWEVMHDGSQVTYGNFDNSENTEVWYTIRNEKLYADCYFVYTIRDVDMLLCLLDELDSIYYIYADEFEDKTRTNEQKLRRAKKYGREIYNLDDFFSGIGLTKAVEEDEKEQSNN